MDRAMRKRVFGACADSEGPDQTAQTQSDHGLRCPLTESFGTAESINGKQMPGLDFAHPWDKSEYMHVAHVRRHLFA